MRRGHMSSIKKRYHPRSTRSTKKSTRVKIAASHQRTQKLRWNQRTNPSKLNACCFFARQMTWYFAASRRYHRFSSRAPRFVAGGRAFTGFLLIGDYLQNPWGTFETRTHMTATFDSCNCDSLDSFKTTHEHKASELYLHHQTGNNTSQHESHLNLSQLFVSPRNGNGNKKKCSNK